MLFSCDFFRRPRFSCELYQISSKVANYFFNAIDGFVAVIAFERSFREVLSYPPDGRVLAAELG